MNVNKPIITVVGSYAAGLTMRVKRFPTVGETLMGHSYNQLHGGKGSNQAIGCARLGAQVNFIACIGNDLQGKNALALYKDEKISCDFVKITNHLPTGVGFIIVNENGDNIITLDLGANRELNCEYIEELSGVIASSDVLLIQLEIPTDTVYTAAKIAKKFGVKVILNPAPFQRFSNDIWQYIDIVTPNEKEAKLILGYSPDEEVEIESLAKELVEKTKTDSIITLGGRGVCLSKCSQNTIEKMIPVRTVDVVDSTGAGDTFNAALGVAVAEGMSLNKAIRFASAAATLSVMKYGVIESMPNCHEVADELKAYATFYNAIC